MQKIIQSSAKHKIGIGGVLAQGLRRSKFPRVDSLIKRLTKISSQRIKRKVYKGSPCLNPLPGYQVSETSLLSLTLKLAVEMQE